MTYSTKTRSNTPTGRYHVRQTLSHWKTRQKTNRRQKTEDRRQKTEAKPCHALGSSQTTILPLMLPKLGSRLCCRLQLSWLPVSRSSEGDTQSCCIVIVLENIYYPAVLAVYCIEGSAPTSSSVVDSRTQPLGPNHGLCCRCRNWRRFSMAMLTSARQTKWKCWFPF